MYSNSPVRIFLLALVLLGIAQGDVLVDNLNAPSQGTSNGVTPNRWQGQPFSTDNQAYILDSVTLRLQQYAAGTPLTEIYTDNSGRPGSSIGSLTPPSIGDWDNYTFDAPGTIALSASTTYWVVVKPTIGGYNWATPKAGEGGSTNGPGTIVMRYGVSLDQGGSWLNGTTTMPQLLRVDVVPEPATTPLLAIGCGVVAVLRRKRALGGM